jgi:hypothetical protein
MKTLQVEIVSRDGSVDQEATRQAFETALETHLAQVEIAHGVVAGAVDAVFSDHPQAMAMPTIAALACQKLNATPENHASLTEAVLDYVRANNKGDNSLFVSVRGRSGGTIRRSDLPAAV